jgi:hypothetical protein
MDMRTRVGSWLRRRCQWGCCSLLVWPAKRPWGCWRLSLSAVGYLDGDLNRALEDQLSLSG